MADSTNTSRRAILKAVPAAGLMVALPLAVAGDEGGEIMALFRQWRTLSDYRNGPIGDDERDALTVGPMSALVAAVAAVPARTAQEIAAKVLVDTCGGDFGLEAHTKAELWDLAG